MATKVVMPQGGQNITEGIVVKWLKAEGDAVQQGEVICEVETEKAVFEVESPEDGVLLKIVVAEGKAAPIFATIGIIGQPGEQVDLEKFLADEKKDEHEIDVSGTREQAPAPQVAAGREGIKASGRAKKLADEKGIDLAQIQGTGPKGRITEKDILERITRLKFKAEQTTAPAPTPHELIGKVTPMSKIRKVIARRMQQSKQTIPHFYVTVAVDVTEAYKLREALNLKYGQDVKISVNDMVVKAAAIAIDEFPQINCKLQDESIVYLDDINIGIAVALSEGLVVPVLPDVGSLSLRGIAKKSKEIIGLAKEGKQANLVVGTFTISNMGMLGIENFIAIVNPPEAAILAVGATEKKLMVAENDTIRIRSMLKMTLSVDHRLIDGVLASKFVNKIKDCIENPQALLS